jgi:hypothetical protein
MKKLYSLVLAMVLMSFQLLFAQATKEVTGKVTDAKDGAPLLLK